MNTPLLLGSKSPSRQMLLRESRIPFELVTQDADETQCDWGQSLAQVTSAIALYKMEHLVLPPGKKEGDVCFVLTADTLSQDSSGEICGKPLDRDDARRMIRLARAGSTLCTSFCLDRKIWRSGKWHIDERIHENVHAAYTFFIPEEWVEWYLDNSIGIQCANAIAIEGLGAQFLKEVRGSHSTIIGLPLFEVRMALTTLGFFK